MLTLAFVKYSSRGRELGSYHGTVYPDTFDVAATHVHGITPVSYTHLTLPTKRIV